VPLAPVGPTTRQRVLDAALRAFAAHGYEATSLDALAAELGIRKQTILYHFVSKEQLLDAVIEAAGAELIDTVESALSSPPRSRARIEPGWWRVEAAVRAVFRLAGRRPELLGLLREVSRLGPPAATSLRDQLDPFIARATAFLDKQMTTGGMRRQDSLLLLLNAYSTVIGAATEIEVLQTFGVAPTARTLVRRRAELLDFLRSALVAP
jgi:TetR/AcrR family transcriptional regulator